MALKIEHRLGIRATSERIWELVSGLEAWERWNPIHPGASGSLGFNAPLTVTEAYPGEDRRTIEVRVHDWAPMEQLVWRDKGFLWTSLRFLEIEELAPGSCIFSNGIVFQGLLGQNELRRRGRAFKQGFQTLGETIKTLAEQET